MCRIGLRGEQPILFLLIAIWKHTITPRLAKLISDIDNAQPIVTAVGAPQITGDRARMMFTATDQGSYLNRAEYSVNGGEWRVVYAEDGISDGPEERYTVEIRVPDQKEYTVTLRVFDASGNAGNARAVVKKQ